MQRKMDNHSPFLELPNIGNTCYIATAIHMFEASGVLNSNTESKTLVIELLTNLFQLKHRSEWERVVSTLLDAMTKFEPGCQGDAMDFLNSMYMLTKCTVLDRYFFMHTEDTLRCISCKVHKVITNSSCPIIPVYLVTGQEQVTMSERIHKYFKDKPIEDGVCSHCGTVGRLRVVQKITTAPEVLTIWIYRWHESKSRKNSLPIKVDNILMLQDHIYSVCAVANHFGTTLKSGHFVCDKKIANRWVQFNDDHMSVIEPPYIISSTVTCGIMYKKVSDPMNMEKVERLNGNQPKAIAQTLKQRTIKVYISLTHKDMHGERDKLNDYVLPKLTSRVSGLHMKVELIKCNRSVEIRFSQIARCDYFVCVLGERYGYIPTFDKASSGSTLDWLKDYPNEMSMIELEFIQAHRTLGEGKIFVYIRDSTFVQGVDQKWKKMYAAESTDAETRLTALKKKILSTKCEVFKGYPCLWGGILDDKPFTLDLEEFGQHVLDRLWSNIYYYNSQTIESVEENAHTRPEVITTSQPSETDEDRLNKNRADNDQANKGNGISPSATEHDTSCFRTVTVFISSSYHDMHGERNFLSSKIFPELRLRAKSIFLQLLFVFGSKKCLRNSLSLISHCDYFVGILGENYGFIPMSYPTIDGDQFDWLLTYPDGRSKTEFEFEQALKTTSKNKTFFYMRNAAFIEDIPDQWKVGFLSEQENATKLADLREKVTSSGCKVVKDYPCSWGGDKSGKLVTAKLEDFGEHIFTDIWNSLESNYCNPATATEAQNPNIIPTSSATNMESTNAINVNELPSPQLGQQETMHRESQTSDKPGICKQPNKEADGNEIQPQDDVKTNNFPCGLPTTNEDLEFATKRQDQESAGVCDMDIEGASQLISYPPGKTLLKIHIIAQLFKASEMFGDGECQVILAFRHLDYLLRFPNDIDVRNQIYKYILTFLNSPEESDVLEILQVLCTTQSCEIPRKYFYLRTMDEALCKICKWQRAFGEHYITEIRVHLKKGNQTFTLQDYIRCQFLEENFVEVSCQMCNKPGREGSVVLRHTITELPEVLSIRLSGVASSQANITDDFTLNNCLYRLFFVICKHDDQWWCLHKLSTPSLLEGFMAYRKDVCAAFYRKIEIQETVSNEVHNLSDRFSDMAI